LPLRLLPSSVHEPTVNGEGLEFDREADSFLVSKSRADLRPLLRGLAALARAGSSKDYQNKIKPEAGRID
jgi:hypothetical protein